MTCSSNPCFLLKCCPVTHFPCPGCLGLPLFPASTLWHPSLHVATATSLMFSPCCSLFQSSVFCCHCSAVFWPRPPPLDPSPAPSTLLSSYSVWVLVWCPQVTVDEGDGKMGWLLLRASLHDPLLVLNVESELEGGELASSTSFIYGIDQYVIYSWRMQLSNVY